MEELWSCSYPAALSIGDIVLKNKRIVTVSAQINRNTVVLESFMLTIGWVIGDLL